MIATRIYLWILLMVSSVAIAHTPCDGINRDLRFSSEQIVSLKANIDRQASAEYIDIKNIFSEQGWSVLHIDSHNSDEAWLFFSGDIMTAHYVTLWSGAATIFEGPDLVAQFKKEAPGIPDHLARCLAWHIAERGKIPGVYSSMLFHSADTGDIIGDEMMIGFSESQGYWVVFQHAEGGAPEPVIAPVTVDDSTGHFSFRLPGEMAAWGEFHGKVTEGDELIGVFDNGNSLKLPRKASFWQ